MPRVEREDPELTENREDKENLANKKNKRRLKINQLPPNKPPSKKRQLMSQLLSVRPEEEVVLVKANNDGYWIFRLISEFSLSVTIICLNS
jgi:hypothetical protein